MIRFIWLCRPASIGEVLEILQVADCHIVSVQQTLYTLLVQRCQLLAIDQWLILTDLQQVSVVQHHGQQELVGGRQSAGVSGRQLGRTVRPQTDSIGQGQT